MFGLSSLSVNAAEVENPYHTFIEYSYRNTRGTTVALGSIITYPNNGTIESKELNKAVSSTFPIDGFTIRITYANDDHTPLIPAERTADYRIDNIILHNVEAWGGQQPWYGVEGVEVVSAYIYYSNGETEGIGADLDLGYADKYSLSGQGIYAEHDVTKIEFVITGDYNYTDTQITFEGFLGEERDHDYMLTLDLASREEGFLAGILDFIGGIFEYIVALLESVQDGFVDMVNGFSNIGEGLTDIWTEIKNLPTLIRDFIYDLFVPDADYLATFIEDMQANRIYHS